MTTGEAAPSGERCLTRREPVAIVGFSFRFGGEATTPDKFWGMLTNGHCAVSSIPKDRFNAEAFYHPDTNRLDRLPVKYGNFITEDIAAFDASFFGIKPAEAAAMDPQSRKLLETTYRALENAGIPIERCARSNTCVFTGISSDDYRLMYVKDPSYPIRHAATGMAAAMLANKISWFYDFKGPSVQLDTACSASLTAVHLAVRSIQSGESDMGIVGGANLYLTPESISPLGHLNFLSPDSRCYSFDHRANGYSRGDGYGILVLKPMSKARADRDPIRAVIRSTALAQNGRTVGGITKVNFEAQRNMIQAAYRVGDVDPALTRYVEAHGPGTEGDVVETSALAAIFSEHRSTEEPLYVGSVKANVGHLEGTSGIAGLVKVILMLEKSVIPKLANFEKLHPGIRGDEWHMAFPTENVPWPAGKRQASINSFGFGGANAHVILQDGSEYIDQPDDSSGEKFAELHPHLLVWSTADESGIQRVSAAMEEYASRKAKLSSSTLRNLTYTLATRRSKLSWKATLVVPAAVESEPQLDFKGLSKPIRSLRPPPLVFIFTGQGANWGGMGSQFLYNRVFRDSLSRCSEYLTEAGSTWDVIEELSKMESTSSVINPGYSQPLCVAVQIALVDMLRSFGIRPAYVVGHSSGEIAAAYTAGAISARSASQIAYFRGQVIARNFRESGRYGMLVVGLAEPGVQPYISRLRNKIATAEVFIACINSPRNVTLSGNLAQLRVVQTMLEADSVFVRVLPVSAPYHSPLLAQFAGEHAALLEALEPGQLDEKSPTIISSVTAQPVSPEQLCEASYWAGNLTSPVQFKPAIDTLVSLIEASNKSTTLGCMMEIGPYGALRAPIRDTMKDASCEVLYFSGMDRGQLSADRLFHTLGQLHCLGYPLDLMAVNELDINHVRCLTDLPEYPFNHSHRYWHESEMSKNYRFGKYPRHDLLGFRAHDWNPLAPRWRNCIRILENPWIEDHRVGGALIYPGAGMLVMAIEAVAQYVKDIEEAPIAGFSFSDVIFHSTLNLTTEQQGTTTEFSLVPSTQQIRGIKVPKHFQFKLCVSEDGVWREVCHGTVAVEFKDRGVSTDLANERSHQESTDFANYTDRYARCKERIMPHKLYTGLRKIGLDVGPTFQVFDNIKYDRKGGLAAANIRLRNWALKGNPEYASPHIIHPTALDGMLQLIIVALSAGTRKSTPTMVPSHIREMRISAEGLSDPGHLVAVSKSEYLGLRHTTSEVLAVDPKNNKVRIAINGLETIIINAVEAAQAIEEDLTAFTLQWEPYQEPNLSHEPTQVLRPGEQPRIVITAVNARDSEPLEELARAIGCELLANPIKVDVQFVSWEKLLLWDLPFASDDKIHFSCIHQAPRDGSKSDAGVYFAIKHLIPRSSSIFWVSIPDNSRRVKIGFHGTVVGLSRTVRNEYPDLPFITLSLDDEFREAVVRSVVLKAMQFHRFAGAKISYEPELRCRLVNNLPTLEVPRLLYSKSDVENLKIPARMSEAIKRPFRSSNDPPLTLSVTTPGLLDTLTFISDTDTHTLLPKEVLIEPAWVGLNFLDVLTALGRIPQNSVLGIEGAGIVINAGAEADLQPGDRVAMLTDGTFRTHIKIDHRTAVKLPGGVSLRDAASVAGTACTVYRSFIDVARLEVDETVLIHAGAGATGQMAIQLAKHIGARIFVTVGSDKKRELVRETYGIPPEHIFNSRDSSFISAVKRLTKGRGVDVVLNSLAGELLEAAWTEVIAPFGRWVEIGKRDIIDNKPLGMRSFLHNVTFSCIDLTGIWRQRPTLMRRLLEDVFKLVAAKVLRPPTPVTEFGLGDIQAAFRTLQRSNEGGKVVVNMDGSQKVMSQKVAEPRWSLKGDRSYLLVGGLGGLGREVARWMVRRGAKSLVLLSRSGVGGDDRKLSLLEDLEDAGCTTKVLRCDVADKKALKAVLLECEETMPPIAGCIQSSMVLRDKYFADMTPDDWTESTSPKITGSQNLDDYLPPSLDFFILLSSLVGIAGAAGQGNYAAGCAFQDALARSRVTRGEKAVSLDLGMIADEGVVAENDNLARTMKSFGHYQSMTMANIEVLLNRYCDPSFPLLSPDECQLVCGIRPPAAIRARGFKEPAWMAMPMFHSLHELKSVSSVQATPTALQESYQELLRAALTLEEAAGVITVALMSVLGTALGVAVDDIDTSRPIHLYGVDSLVAVELRNWFGNKIKADVAVLHILGNSSAEALGAIAAESSLYTLALRK